MSNHLIPCLWQLEVESPFLVLRLVVRLVPRLHDRSDAWWSLEFPDTALAVSCKFVSRTVYEINLPFGNTELEYSSIYATQHKQMRRMSAKVILNWVICATRSKFVKLLLLASDDLWHIFFKIQILVVWKHDQESLLTCYVVCLPHWLAYKTNFQLLKTFLNSENSNLSNLLFL